MNTLPADVFRVYYRSENWRSSLSVRTCGREASLNGYHWGPGMRAYYLLHHIIDGTYTVEIDGKEYLCQPGDTFFIFPQTAYSMSCSATERCEYCWVGFSGLESDMILQYLRVSKENPIIHSGSTSTVRTLHSEIYNARGETLAASFAMASKLYLLFSHLLSETSQKESAEENDYLQKALEYIHRHFTEDITVNDVCSHLNVSRSWLFRIFSTLIGESPSNYITAQRLALACSFLRDTQMNISEIADRVGYADSLYFSRIFKKHVGFSPREYRRQHNDESQ